MSISHIEKFGYTQQLKRSLGLWQLTAFGLNYMIPLSPAIIFGFVLALSGGTVALPFLIAGIAIFLTAMSYAVMVRHFPLSGSLYNFIARAWHPKIGFIGGWVLLLDYLLITTVTSMSASVYIHQLLPNISYSLILFIFILASGAINLRGIKIIASVGLMMLVIAEIVVIASFIVWAHAIHTLPIGTGRLFTMKPFHFFNISSLINATSLAVASYLGFDAITTLAEEAKNPIKDIPKAITLCIIIGGITMIVTGYLGVLAIPNWHQLINSQTFQATTLFYVSNITGGHAFALFYSLGFILSMMVFNMVATAATARLLFGMGRDGVLNKKLFGAINEKYKTPHWNIILIMAISFIIGNFSSIDQIANLVNYGALFGFALLNLSVVWFYFSNRNKLEINKNYFRYLIAPIFGFVIVMWVFYGLNEDTHILGTIWLFIGIIYLIAHQKKLFSFVPTNIL
ncbi:MAG TPA: APC family permease [Coxiellaceae bacterium]|nr:MAG: hypothetical protein A3E81_03345 [Gammaproteobacteria bacterium RIFCSPHIGHO2_12_FULL_36_30]HLB56364.1 APC family permease [Coxiellaceae bacterium]